MRPFARIALPLTVALASAACTAPGASSERDASSGPAQTEVAGPGDDANVVTIDELVSTDTLRPELEQFLRSAVATSDSYGESQPGSYEPLLAADYDTANSPGSLFASAPGGDLGGKVLIANPANREFRATLLCLHGDTQVPCSSTMVTVTTELEPGEASVIPVEFTGLADGDEVTAVLLVHDDRVDPLPASVAAVVVVGDSMSSGRHFRLAPSGETVTDCSDRVRLASDPADDRGRIPRGSAIEVVFETCQEQRIVPLVFADRAHLLPLDWSALRVGAGIHRFPVPNGAMSAEASTVQAAALVFSGSGPGMLVSGWFAEELIIITP